MLLGFKHQFVTPILQDTKLHTIRDDIHNRWQPGKTIHMCTGLRTKDLNIFNTKPCISTQSIIINAKKRTVDIIVPFRIREERVELSDGNIYWLAINDGFTNEGEFWSWFYLDLKDKPGLEGKKKLIHWTHLTYPIEGISDLPF